jgi:phosphoglycerate dehydrogenase-like enzyme
MGATLGVVGYGDIGQRCAKLAHAFGMKIIALRNRPNQSIPVRAFFVCFPTCRHQ